MAGVGGSPYNVDPASFRSAQAGQPVSGDYIPQYHEAGTNYGLGPENANVGQGSLAGITWNNSPNGGQGNIIWGGDVTPGSSGGNTSYNSATGTQQYIAGYNTPPGSGGGSTPPPSPAGASMSGLMAAGGQGDAVNGGGVGGGAASAPSFAFPPANSVGSGGAGPSGATVVDPASNNASPASMSGLMSAGNAGAPGANMIAGPSHFRQGIGTRMIPNQMSPLASHKAY